MDSIVNFLNQLPGWMQKIGFALSIVLIGAAAILMMTGQEGSAKSKKWLLYIVMGIGILFMAASIVSTVRGAVA